MKHSYPDAYSYMDSFIHRIEPRIKIVVFLTFILAVIFTPLNSFVSFGLYSLLLMSLIVISGVPWSFIFQRMAVILPFILMVTIFMPFMTHRDGLALLGNILLRALLSSLCMILLMNSTPFADFLKAMEKLRFPQIMIMILSFMYRYLFVAQDEILRMVQAKESRSVGCSRWLATKTFANMLGVLFIRSYEKAEAVYLAMCSRGFNGKIRTMTDFKVGRKDIAFLFCMLIILFSIRLTGH